MPGVADYLIDRLRAAGVRMLFGLPGGGGNLDLIQAAGRAGLPFVLTTTETGSAIAAIAQSEITGAPGACVTTLGPGAASVVNGIACAKLERAPLLVITDSYASGTAFEHQRLDHHALLAPVTKFSGSLAPDVASSNVGYAFDRLAELPPGPVHLDCPADFEKAIAGDSGLGARTWGHTDALSDPALRTLVASARKPVLIVGLAARQPAYAAAVRTLCERRHVPALVSYKAKGVVPDSHPWFGGVFTHGAIERPILEESDLIIGIGFDPVEILPKPWNYRQPVVSVARWEMAEDHVPFKGQHVGTD
jgi:acetolactate synthase I/II/III large subunit